MSDGMSYVTLNASALVVVPDRVVTAMCPLVPPAGTVATTCVADTDMIVAGAPSKVTRVVLERFFPVIVTVVPTAPFVGLNPVMAGVTLVVIRPMPLSNSVNHRAPSDPLAIATGPAMPAAL